MARSTISSLLLKAADLRCCLKEDDLTRISVLSLPFQILYRCRSRISSACVSPPNETVIDGEIIAFGKDGRPLRRPPEPSRRSTAVAVRYLRPDDPRTPSLRRKRPGRGSLLRFSRSCSHDLARMASKNARLPISRTAQGAMGRGGLTAEDMKHCRWLRPRLVGAFEFMEWTPAGHLRHPKFVGLREDKKARDVIRDRLASQLP